MAGRPAPLPNPLPQGERASFCAILLPLPWWERVGVRGRTLEHKSRTLESMYEPRLRDPKTSPKHCLEISPPQAHLLALPGGECQSVLPRPVPFHFLRLQETSQCNSARCMTALWSAASIVGREVQGRHHHSRYRQGKAARGQGRRRGRPRCPRRTGPHPCARRQGRRHHPVRQVVRDGSKRSTMSSMS